MLIGVVVLCVLWQILGQTNALGPSFPSLTTVFGTLFAPAQSALFLNAASATAFSACIGLLVGGGAGVVIAGLRQTLISTRPGFDRLAALLHAIPYIAIAPVAIIVFGREQAPAAVASLACFFPVYAGSTVAFAAAAQRHQDLFTVLGSSRMARLVKLDLPAAIPGMADALKLAAPSAVLGAVVGEWFGAPNGVGLLILSSAQNYNIPLLWSAAILSTVMAIIGFALFAVLQHAAMRRFT
jgi:ABC-type nitrate/sulfonate/bicarbonate transport system, permease component